MARAGSHGQAPSLAVSLLNGVSAATSVNPVVVHFGDWRLLPQARELWHRQDQVALPPRALDCLVYLIEHRERAVGRDELISAIWGRADISDTLVAQTVLRIRRTLAENGRGQEWVRTVPRFGYRWVAPVHVTDHDVDNADPVADPAPPTGGRKQSPRWPMVLSLSAVFAVALLAVVLWPGTSERSGPAGTPAQMAADTWLVLPVVGEGSAAPEWIRLGAMDAIAEQLRRAGLVVLPSSQALTLATEFAMPGQPPDIGNLRLASGSRHVVQPQSAQVDQRWRISLTVHDPERAPSLFRGLDADLLAAARQAGAALLAGQGLVDRLVDGGGPRDELLARAEAALLAGHLAEGESILVQAPSALAEDPLVQLKLAQVRYRMGDTDRALPLIDSVLAREDIDDDTRALALIRSGNARIRAGDLPMAEQVLTRALALLTDAGSPALQGEALNGLGVTQQMRGRLVDAGTSLARAAALQQHGGDPLAYARTLLNLGLHAMESGRPHEAIERFLQAEPIVLRFGGADEQSSLQQSIAWTRLFLAQPAAAREPSMRAVSLAAGTENTRVRRQSLGLAVRVAVANGELARAETFADQYVAANPDQPATFLPLYRALIAEARQDWSRTREQALRALDDPAISDRESRGRSAELALAAALALHDEPTASRALAVLVDVAGEDGDGRWAVRERLAQTRAGLVRDGAGTVVESLRAIWGEAGRTRLAPVDQLDVGLALVDALLGAGHPDQAQRQLELLLPWIDGDPRVALADAAIARQLDDKPRRDAALARARDLAGERVLPAWVDVL